MGLPFWEYKICTARLKVTNKRTFSAGFRTIGHWTLIINEMEYGLEEGLAKMGEKGWELAGVQNTKEGLAEGSAEEKYPESLYIFKRPI